MPELRLPEPGNWAQTGKVALPAKIALAVAFCYVVVRGLIAVYEGREVHALKLHTSLCPHTASRFAAGRMSPPTIFSRIISLT